MKQQIEEPPIFSRPIVLWLMVASIGFYAGDGHGWLIGAVAAFGFVAAVLVYNMLILAKPGNLAWTTRMRVVLYFGFILVIALTRAQTCASGTCTRLIG